MPPDDRRRAIVDAVVPLLLQHGDEVSTKQIAEAAGIAEGTIFRVFPDKAALLMAAAEETMNPADGGAELEAALAGHDDLRERVRITTERMIERSDRVIVVMMALRRIWLSQPPKRRQAAAPPAFMREANQSLQAMLTRVFEPHRAELSVDPSTAATVLRTLVLGSRHPGVDPDTRLTAEQIVEVLLDGIRTRTEKGD
jgi:AcrR family transcriptional regulator